MIARDEKTRAELGRLFDAILKLQSREECRRFFEDICTVNELTEMAKRLKVAQMLREGMSYVQIGQLTGVSTATISRVNRCLSWGEGGYELALDRMVDGAEREIGFGRDEEEQA